MKNERYSSYEELPLMLSAKEASAVLGISLAKTYELTKSRGFPVIKVGKRVLIPRDKLIDWIDQASVTSELFNSLHLPLDYSPITFLFPLDL